MQKRSRSIKRARRRPAVLRGPSSSVSTKTQFICTSPEATSNFAGKLFSVFTDMDKMIGSDFDKGLAQLKSYLSEVPESRFKTPMKVAEIPRLFTPETFCKLVIRAQREAQP